MNELKITIVSIIGHLWILLAGLIIFFLMIYYNYLNTDEINWSSIFKIYFLTYMVLIFLPIIILFASYIRINRGCRVLLDGNHFTFVTPSFKILFVKEDIEHVLKVMTPNQANSRTHFLIWENYYYSIITLKDGKKLIVTSLMVPELILPIDLGLIEVKKTFFPIYY